MTAAKVKIKAKEEITQILHRLTLSRQVEHIL
jgi:hypothetical protein